MYVRIVKLMSVLSLDTLLLMHLLNGQVLHGN